MIESKFCIYLFFTILDRIYDFTTKNTNSKLFVYMTTSLHTTAYIFSYKARPVMLCVVFVTTNTLHLADGTTSVSLGTLHQNLDILLLRYHRSYITTPKLHY